MISARIWHAAIALLGETAAQRFWAAVEFTSSCCLWRGPVRPSGTGRFSWTDSDGFHHRDAHALMYECANGEAPDRRRVFVAQSCDNRLCVAPTHLQPMSRAEYHDWLRSLRRDFASRHPEAVRGERNNFAKLTEQGVIAMRTQYSTTSVSYQELASEFNVSTKAVADVLRGRRWQHVGPAARARSRQEVKLEGEEHPNHKLTAEEVVEIRRLYRAGDCSYTDLGKEFGVTAANIYSVVRGKTWRHIPGWVEG